MCTVAAVVFAFALLSASVLCISVTDHRLPINVSMTWFAPVLSHSGYGKEALEYLTGMDTFLKEHRIDSGAPLKRDGLVSVGSIATDNHGDTADPAVLLGLPPPVRLTVQKQLHHARVLSYYGRPVDDRSADEDEQHGDAEVLPEPMSEQQHAAVAVCHSEPGAWSVPVSLYPTTTCPPWYAHVAIGRTMFETDRIPNGWVRRINSMDQVWVPTAFHVETFVNSGVDPAKLLVIPESIDANWWSRERVCPSGSSSGDAAVTSFFASIHQSKMHSRCSVKFLSVFKWEDRKGWDVLLKAFYEEFIYNADTLVREEDEGHRGVVCLIIKTSAYHNPELEEDDDEYHEQIERLFSEVYGSDYKRRRVPSASKAQRRGLSTQPDWMQIHVIGDAIDSSVYPLLYCGVDALVQPSRGEGWGRPHMEAMAMGVPVIATNWSGTTAFLNDRNGFPLNIRPQLSTISTGAFKGHKWAEPDKEHLRSLMRSVVTSLRSPGSPTHSRLQEKVRVARSDIVTQYDSVPIAKLIIEATESLVAKLCFSSKVAQGERCNQQTWRRRLMSATKPERDRIKSSTESMVRLDGELAADEL